MSQSASKSKQQNMTIIGGIIAAAFIVGAVAIFLSQRGFGSSGADVNYDEIPQSRTEDGGFVLGNPDAQVTVVEFADFLCPHCQQYKPEIDKFIEEVVAGGQAKFEYRFLPTQGQTSEFAARVAECADEFVESGFWKAHDELFRLASRGVRDDLGRELAESLDIPYADLLECQQDAEQVYNDQRVATFAEVSGTPAVRVRYGDGNPQVIPGYERGGAPFGVLSSLVVGTES